MKFHGKITFLITKKKGVAASAGIFIATGSFDLRLDELNL